MVCDASTCRVYWAGAMSGIACVQSKRQGGRRLQETQGQPLDATSAAGVPRAALWCSNGLHSHQLGGPTHDRCERHCYKLHLGNARGEPTTQYPMADGQSIETSASTRRAKVPPIAYIGYGRFLGRFPPTPRDQESPAPV